MIPKSLFKFDDTTIDLDCIIYTLVTNKSIKSRKPITMNVYLQGGFFETIKGSEDIDKFNNAWYARKKNESVTIEPIADKKLKVEKPFPKIMQSRDNPKLLVLFSESRRGVVVRKDDFIYPLGHYTDRWVMHTFKDFDEPFIMENK